MKNDSVLKTPQMLTHLRNENDITIQSEGEEVPQMRGVIKFSHKDEFGWRFPKVTDNEKKNNVVDVKWLNAYNDEINELQISIKQERSLSFSNEAQNLLENQTLKSEHSKLEESFNSTRSFKVEIPVSSFNESLRQKERVKSDCSVVQTINNKVLSSTPKSKVSYSIRNCPSRDSGISTSDDISDALPEIHSDLSLLEELEGIGDFDDTAFSTDQSSSLNNLELSKQSEYSNELLSETECLTSVLPVFSQQKCPVWYKKYSVGENDLILNFNSINWGLELNFGDKESSKSAFDSLSSKSDKRSSSSDDSAYEAESEDRRRQRLQEVWTACNRLETLSLRRGSSFRGLSEVTELVESLNKIDSRLEILKCDLHNLSQQATETRHEFNKLQKRASSLLKSTKTSRHHMTLLFSLKNLKDRLHEEWWILQHPNLVTTEDNYIV